MSRLPTSSERRRQHGGLWLWALVVLVGAMLGALLAFHLVIRQLEARLLVTDADLLVYVDQTLEVDASVLNALDIRLNETVSTRVPVDTLLSVPVEQALELDAVFDAVVPIRVDVPVNDVILLEQDVELDTVVEADLLGETFQLPLRGRFPIRAEVPIALLVPIDQPVRLRFTAPIKARLRQNLEVPLKTEIVAEVPLQTEMSVPVLNDVAVTVTIPRDPPLPVRLNYADLRIPVGDLRFDLVDDEPVAPSAETPP
jgi:hypothetical protein